MKKLISGIVEFRKGLTEEKRELFARLALGQKPDALFIACSDSRVVPNLFASTNPGDLFVIRNIGNLVPGSSCCESSISAALEFSIYSLKIKDIIVCGHSECGAMIALCENQQELKEVARWLNHAKEALTHLDPDSKLSAHNELSLKNVLLQIDHLRSYPFIKKREEEGTLRLHGMWFDIARADVYFYDEKSKNFELIDEIYSKKILEKLL